MWLAVITVAMAGASGIDGLERTILSDKATGEERNRAVVELSELAVTDEDARWSVLELRHQLDPEDAVAKVATAAAIQLATLEDLMGVGWPTWARGHVSARMDALLPERCDDPDLWTLQLDVIRVAETCAEALDVNLLVDEVVTGEDPVLQQRAADMVAELAYHRPSDTKAQLTHAIAWQADVEFPMIGEDAHLHQLEWSPDERRAVALELVTWRVGVTLVGMPEVPARLDAELRAFLAPELEAYGEPSGTQGWLHVLGSTGADPAPVLARLGLTGSAQWEMVVDEDRLLKGTVADAMPLISHRSAVVRARAAARLETHPAATAAALRKSWRYAPGRSAPLRGEVAAPALEFTELAAEKWADTLVEWAGRSVRQRDDAALRATLWLLSEPSLSTALSDTQRDDVTSDLLRLADGHPGRAGDLVQAMDAMLRGVPFDEGAIPFEDGVEMHTEQVRWELTDSTPPDDAPAEPLVPSATLGVMP